MTFFLESKEKTLQNMDGKIYALKHNTVTENAMNKTLLVGNLQKARTFHGFPIENHSSI
jgi:hypothetical protein